jgi:prophage DNA circulation protein
MGWREQLRPASFRGVPFQVEGHDADGGRRGPVHEYPQRDTPFREDLGRQAETFRVDAYVIGGDYFPARDALLGALRAEGPGTLVHPTLGTLEVCVDRWRLGERFGEGGMARFSLDFVESGADRFPTETPNTRARVIGAAGSARGAVTQAAQARYGTTRVQQWVTTATTRRVLDFAERAAATARRIASGSTLDAFTVALQALSPDAARLVSTPLELMSSISRLIQQISDLGSDPSQTVSSLEFLAGWGMGFPPIIGTTPARIALAAREDALVRIVRSSAAVEASRRATEIPLDSYDSAVALRDRVIAMLDPEIAAAGDRGDDTTTRALEDLLAEVAGDLRARGAELRRVRALTLEQSIPSVVLAYRLYAAARRADEIVARNRIRDPGALPAGVALEVLSG